MLTPRKRHSTAVAEANPSVRYWSFYVVLALLAVPLYWLLPASFDGAGVAWRTEYSLWAAVPVCTFAVLVRHLARTYLRCK